MNHSLSELKELMCAKLDAHEILDVLELSIEDMLEYLSEVIEDQHEDLEIKMHDW
jgi:hypothetical protein